MAAIGKIEVSIDCFGSRGGELIGLLVPIKAKFSNRFFGDVKKVSSVFPPILCVALQRLS